MQESLTETRIKQTPILRGLLPALSLAMCCLSAPALLCNSLSLLLAGGFM